MWAAWYGNTEVVTQLLAAPGCNKDKLNNAGKNAVMYAAEAGRVDTARILLAGVEQFDQDEEDRAVRKNRQTTKNHFKNKMLNYSGWTNCWIKRSRLAVTFLWQRWSLVNAYLKLIESYRVSFQLFEK